jgi:Protein of unknown function (DUF3383)
MASLDISNVIVVTLLSALRGLSDVNTSILALITSEAPISSSYGTYGIYKNPNGVASDFGSNSATYRLAVDVFSQNPNILSGGGYLVVIPRLASAAAQPAVILSSAAVDLTKLTATDYKIKAAISGAAAAEVAIGDIDTTSLATVQATLNSAAITSAGLQFVVTGSLTSAYITLKTIATGATTAIVLSATAAGTDISPLLNISLASSTGAAAGVERVKDAVLRTYGSIPYFGIILDAKQSDSDLTELAATIQTMDKLLFVASSTVGDIAGIFTTLQGKSYTHTRMLYYSVSADNALDFAAGYAGRGLSIKMSGSNTAHTMHLKDITGLDADSGMTQTILTAAMNAGVDTYPDIGGAACVFISGVNQFFDQVYTRLAFKLRLQIAGFNYLAQTNTKIPQTEQGMSGLKGAYRKICNMFVTNGTFAPGTWNSSTTFGDPDDHVKNIAAMGFYIYSDPIASQSQAERETRVAPGIYIAAKNAGAIHSSDVTVYVES